MTHLSSHAGRKLSATNIGSSHNRSFTNSKLLNEQYKISDQILDLENLKKISERVEHIKNDQNPEQAGVYTLSLKRAGCTDLVLIKDH